MRTDAAMANASGGGNATATWIGYVGLIPFFVSAALMWHPTWRGLAHASLLAYAAVILSFLGAVHWGIAMSGPGGVPNRHYVWSVLPALAAWCFALLPPPYSLPLLALAFLTWWLQERTLFTHLLPAWYMRLRDRLTLAVVTLVVIVWLAMHALPSAG